MMDWADQQADRIVEQWCQTIWRTHGLPAESYLFVMKVDIAAGLRETWKLAHGKGSIEAIDRIAAMVK